MEKPIKRTVKRGQYLDYDKGYNHAIMNMEDWLREAKLEETLAKKDKEIEELKNKLQKEYEKGDKEVVSKYELVKEINSLRTKIEGYKETISFKSSELQEYISKNYKLEKDVAEISSLIKIAKEVLIEAEKHHQGFHSEIGRKLRGAIKHLIEE